MGAFDGQTAIITGASRGVGRQLAIDLAAAGANVVVNYVNAEGAAAEVVGSSAPATATPFRAVPTCPRRPTLSGCSPIR